MQEEKHKIPEEKKVLSPSDGNTLPKDYDATIERLSLKLSQENTDSNEQKAIIGVGLMIAFLLLFTQITEALGYPFWMVMILKCSVFAESAIPLFLSFFVKNTKLATLLRTIGLIVFISYLYTLFWTGIWSL